jgi:hypothetical protein
MPLKIMWAVALVAGGATFASPMAAVASPGFWLELNPPGAPAHPRVELDVASVQEGLLGPEATVRISRRALQQHEGLDLAYRSMKMHILFHCGARRLEPLAVSFFSGARGQGAEIAARTNLSSRGIPDEVLAPLSPAVLRSLFKAACARDVVRQQ